MNTIPSPRYAQPVFSTPCEESGTTFSEIYVMWKCSREGALSANTKKKYTSLARNHLLPALGDIPVAALKPIHLRAILSELTREGYAPATHRDVRAVAELVMGCAIDNDYILHDPFARVSAAGSRRTHKRALTDAEINAVTACAGHRIYGPALVMLYCGLRRGEALALRTEDIDLERNELHVCRAVSFAVNTPELKEPKTQAGTRTVPIPGVLRPVLHELKMSAAGEWAFPGRDGKLMTCCAFEKGWQSFIKELKRRNPAAPRDFLNGVTPHILRHTYCTLLYDAGVDIKSAQAFMGHADINITLAIYTHLSQTKRAQAAQALDDYLAHRAG